MRKLFFICLYVVGTVCLAQEKRSGTVKENCIGADLAAAARSGALSMTLGHAFGSKWSVGAEAALDIPLLGKRMSEEEAGHYGEMGDEAWPYGDAAYAFGASVQFWPQSAFRGAYMSAGISWGEGIGLDMTAGAGYMVRIWKGLAAGIAYEMKLLKTYRHGASGDEVKINLSYIF